VIEGVETVPQSLGAIRVILAVEIVLFERDMLAVKGRAVCESVRLCCQKRRRICHKKSVKGALLIPTSCREPFISVRESGCTLV
jgi:hypothetical protein